MNSALIITSMDNPLQRLRSIRAEDLPPNQQFCRVCVTPWGYPIHADGPFEYPVILTCGCIAGSLCLERSFEKSARCPLCNTTIRIIAGVNAPRNHDGDRSSSNRLRQLEVRSGISEWPIPSVEPTKEETEQTKYNRQEKLDVLNSCHGSFLSMRELGICISLVDFRLGTTTSIGDVLDAFIAHPLFRWDREDAVNHDGDSDLKDLGDEDLRDALMLVNMRAGTSLMLDELVMVLSLMNYVHVTNIGLLDVLGVSDARLYDQLDSARLKTVEKELAGAFGALDLRVGSKHAVVDLGDVFSHARL